MSLEAGLDLDQLEELAELSDGAILRRIIDDFHSTVVMLDDAETALSGGDLRTAAALVHKLLGRSLNTGAPFVEGPGRAVERALADDDAQAAAMLMPELRQAVLRAEEALGAYRARRLGPR